MRNFLYLDVDKMYSLSSQLFEGVTESITQSSLVEEQESESQKGRLGTGQFLGDIFRAVDQKKEKRFLHDHSYFLFEERLIQGQKVVSLSSDGQLKPDNIGEKWFVKIQAKAIFNDLNIIVETIENFNEIGRSLTIVGNAEELESAKRNHTEKLHLVKDRNEKNRLEREFKQLTNINNLARADGLFQDPEFLSALKLLLAYGYKDQLELQMLVDDFIFSANLKREYLREREQILIRKYARETNVDLVMLGIITQRPQPKSVEQESVTISSQIRGLTDSEGMRSAVAKISEALTHFERTFYDCGEHEYIIDPIAIYTNI